MTNTVDVDGDKTLGSGDDGTLQHVTSGATITIPADSTHNFLTNDTIRVFRDTSDTVEVVAAEGVTLNAAGTEVCVECGYAKYTKIADNKWIGWGDLAAVVLVASAIVLAGIYSLPIKEGSLMLINYFGE